MVAKNRGEWREKNFCFFLESHLRKTKSDLVKILWDLRKIIRHLRKIIWHLI